jgi:apolipoprotein D and lipocalin family protein
LLDLDAIEEMKKQTPFILALLTIAMTAAIAAQPLRTAPVPLPSLDVTSYMGTWYQVLWFPNRFQKQCVAETAATYRDLGNGAVEVINRCRMADGKMDTVVGVARPPAGVSHIEAGKLLPAQLQVSFLPSWLRWTGIGWGDYWVIDLASDGRYAIISEASRQYLWVLYRQRALTLEDDKLIRDRLQTLGFDLSALQVHPQSAR